MARIEDRTPEGSENTNINDVIAPLMGLSPDEIEQAVIVAYAPKLGGMVFGAHMSEWGVADFLAKALDVLSEGLAQQLAKELSGLIEDEDAEHQEHEHEHFPQCPAASGVSPELN